MANWQDRAHTAAPLPAGLITGAGLTILLGATVLTIGGPLRTALLMTVAIGLFTAVVVTTTRSWTEHRERAVAGAHHRAQRIAMAQALRTGQPPDNPALDAPLLALIEHHQQQRHRMRRWRPLALTLFIVWLGTVLYLGLFGWASLTPFLATLLTVVSISRRQRNRERHLEQRLHSRA
ncbi:hypothetical protein [Actinomadura xylanilytica]|uniref:hypothetical protein n=1 Tax=Actinomadura xylanilytica TaxID=887459 RepID=UPI00255AE2B7|nr:hypothetical protein [Actinomadura xylanilytica]MDL4770714.1 hypothetical protein [Actinomadura xylanilytica]